MKSFPMFVVAVFAITFSSAALADDFQILCEGDNFLKTRKCFAEIRLESSPELGNYRMNGTGELQCLHRDTVVHKSFLRDIMAMGLIPSGFVLTAKEDLRDAIPNEYGMIEVESKPKTGTTAQASYYDGHKRRLMKMSCKLGVIQ